MIVQLSDGDASVSIDTSFGNNAYSMIVRGEELLWTPPDWRSKPALGGIPLLAPWANRIDGMAYSANGHRYLLNPELENLRYDPNHLPIHGLLAFTSEWRVVQQDSRSVTSRLEFWRDPRWMAQFPFAHTIEMTHRLSGAILEIETSIENLSTEPMPLSLGYHPYFRKPDGATFHVAAREQIMLSDKLIPNGERRPVNLSPGPIDAVFTSLTGEEFSVEPSVSVRFGSKYPVAIVYSPANSEFVCFEPMTAQTNAFNSPDGNLQHVAPGTTWRESFWITATRR